MDDRMIPLSVLREYMPKLKDEDLKELGPVEYDQSKVPEVSKKHAENVRRKVYLPDMTESFARGVEYAGLIASEAVDISDETKERQDDVETQFNSVQQELTDKDIISAPEIITARNGEETLKARLDKEQQEISAQLAQTAYITTDTQSLLAAVNTTDQRTVLIGTSLTIEADLHIPENIRLVFRNSGEIYIGSGVTLTIDGYVEAGHYQIFRFADDTSIVSTTYVGTSGETTEPTKVKYNIKLAWFGAKGDAVPPVGTTIGTNLPTGTNDTKAIKRAVDFANKASINGTLTKLKNPMVTVEGQPNASYYVEGDNILGVQSEEYTSVCYQFKSNGAQFFHHVLADTDAFINNGYLLLFPSFKDISVDVYITNGSKRLGKFFNLNGEGKTTIKMFRPAFDRIRVGANNEEYGYKSIYKIDGTQMADNGSVTGGYYGAFERFFDCSNTEAVNWQFLKNYIHPTTDNACIYYVKGVTSGPFKSVGNEIRLSKDGETYLKTIGETISGGVFDLDDRVELGPGIKTTIFDLDYGEVKVTGQNYYAGNGGIIPHTDSFFAKIGPFAKLVIKRCRIPMKEFLIKKVDKITTSSPKEMLVIEDTSLYNAQSSGHPFLLFENSNGTRLTLSNVYDSGMTVRKTKVVNPQGENNVFDYEFGSGITEKKQVMLARNVGSNSYADGVRVRIPYNFVIDQIRLYNTSFLPANIDGIRISLQYATGTEWGYSTTIPLDGAANYGKDLLNNQIITCTNGLVFLEFHFMLGDQRVSAIPPSFVEIEYRGISRKRDFQGDSTGLIRKNIF